MSELKNILDRKIPPVPFEDGDNIPWDEPGFSARMLEEHLSQEHDLASRRGSLVEEHARKLFDDFLHGRPGRVLDMACGPGLYTCAMARLGCSCAGVDFSPASVEHAEETAKAHGLDAVHFLADVREVEPEGGHDLVMMLYGQINVFRKEEARRILERMVAAVVPGGAVVIEPQIFDLVRAGGEPSTSWYSAPRGLFSDRPHLVLQESFFDEESAVRTERFHVIDAETGAVRTHALSTVAYRVEEIEEMLRAAGLTEVALRDPLDGDERSPDMWLFEGRR